MADTTITSVNSVVTLAAPGVFPAPVQLSGFSTERFWTSEDLDLAEIQMGVDGRMTAGYIPKEFTQTYSLQADSPSKVVIETIAAYMKQIREIVYLSGTISLPSTGESVILTKGVLMSYKPLPDAAKVLQPIDFKIVWQTVNVSLL